MAQITTIATEHLTDTDPINTDTLNSNAALQETIDTFSREKSSCLKTLHDVKEEKPITTEEINSKQQEIESKNSLIRSLERTINDPATPPDELEAVKATLSETIKRRKTLEDQIRKHNYKGQWDAVFEMNQNMVKIEVIERSVQQLLTKFQSGELNPNITGPITYDGQTFTKP